MYADKITPSMAKAIDETNRRREKQVAYNNERGIDPQPLRKKIADITDLLAREDADTEELLGSGRGHGPGARRRRAWRPWCRPPPTSRSARAAPSRCRPADLADLIQELTDQMHPAAGELQFELAARLRDEIGELKKELRQMSEATK